jgi:hypothetical protein
LELASIQNLLVVPGTVVYSGGFQDFCLLGAGVNMLKLVIVVLLLAIIISLFSGALFFYKDQGSTKRTLYALGVRITLAILLMITITYGVVSGQLVLNAPWHQSVHTGTAQPAQP